LKYLDNQGKVIVSDWFDMEKDLFELNGIINDPAIFQYLK